MPRIQKGYVKNRKLQKVTVSDDSELSVNSLEVFPYQNDFVASNKVQTRTINTYKVSQPYDTMDNKYNDEFVTFTHTQKKRKSEVKSTIFHFDFN